MLFKKTAVRPALRNAFGARMRRRLTLLEVLRQEFDDPRNRDELLNMLASGFRLPVWDLASLAGGTTPTQQALANPIYTPVALIVNTNQVVNQGDLVRWDSVNYTLAPLTDPTQVPYVPGGNYGFVGVAGGTAGPNVYPAPAAGVPSENLPGVIVQRGGTVGLASIAGEGNYFPLEPVTVSTSGQTGADAQHVSRFNQTTANRVGFIIVHPPATAPGTPGATPAPATVPSGGRVEVWIEPKFPGTYLL